MLSTSLNHAALLVLSLQYIAPCRAQSNICSAAEDISEQFNNYNSTKTIAIPALQINGTNIQDRNPGKLIEDPGKSWYITTRNRVEGINPNTSMQYFYFNTNESNTTGIGLCTLALPTENLGTYTFPRRVLERSIRDNGDCRTMIGDQCLAAWKRQYSGLANRLIYGASCTGTSLNTTVPHECADIVGDSDVWTMGSISAGLNLNNRTFRGDNVRAQNCTNDFEPLNSSVVPSFGFGGHYNGSTRFPTVQVMIFYPNRTSNNPQTGGGTLGGLTTDAHIEIRCNRPDEIQSGSTVPPSAKEILDAGLRYDTRLGANAGKGGGDPNNPNDPNDPSQATSLRATWYLGLLCMVVMLSSWI